VQWAEKKKMLAMISEKNVVKISISSRTEQQKAYLRANKNEIKRPEEACF
jgi:hypothetical protein